MLIVDRGGLNTELVLAQITSDGTSGRLEPIATVVANAWKSIILFQVEQRRTVLPIPSLFQC